MDYPFIVCCAETLEYLEEDAQCVFDRHKFAFFAVSREGFVEGFPFDVLQYEECGSRFGYDCAHWHDVLVIDIGQYGAFGENSFFVVFAAGEFGADCFDDYR